MVNVMKMIKNGLDPKGIMNPYKLFPTIPSAKSSKVWVCFFITDFTLKSIFIDYPLNTLF